jgi:hypothetical protein
MAEENIKAIEALQKLARRVEHGLQRLHPVTDKELAKVREAVREEWSRTHKGRKQQASSQGSQKRKEREKTKEQQQSKSHDHGHSHSF